MVVQPTNRFLECTVIHKCNKNQTVHTAILDSQTRLLSPTIYEYDDDYFITSWTNSLHQMRSSELRHKVIQEFFAYNTNKWHLWDSSFNELFRIVSHVTLLRFLAPPSSSPWFGNPMPFESDWWIIQLIHSLNQLNNATYCKLSLSDVQVKISDKSSVYLKLIKLKSLS